MSRPEDVKCENCCYWKRSNSWDRCHIRSVPYDNFPVRHSIDFCGEFRNEWPVRILDGNNPEHRAEIDAMRVPTIRDPDLPAASMGGSIS